MIDVGEFSELKISVSLLRGIVLDASVEEDQEKDPNCAIVNKLVQ